MNSLWRHQEAAPYCRFECPSPRRIISRLFRGLKDMRKLLQCRKGTDHCKVSVDGGQLESPVQCKESPAASCSTGPEDDSCCSSLVSCRSTAAPHLLQEEENITVSSRSAVCDESRKESVEGMERLEAELEAELEQLRRRLDTEAFIKVTGDGSTAKGSGDLSLGEVKMTDPSEAPIEVHVPVHPVELERKLHKLLQSRQQGTIEELEAALERAKQKLSEKEKEAIWWKNSALFMSRHVPDPLDRS